MKTLISILPILLTLSACGSGGDNTVGSPSTDVSQDEYEAQAEPKISAAADLPDDLQAAALAPGDMPCGLPRIPSGVGVVGSGRGISLAYGPPGSAWDPAAPQCRRLGQHVAAASPLSLDGSVSINRWIGRSMDRYR